MVLTGLILAQAATSFIWSPWIAFALTALIQLITFVWFLGKLNATVERTKDDLADFNHFPTELSSLKDRTSKLEWETVSTKTSVQEMRDSLHRINNKLQEIVIATTRVADSVDALKKEQE